MTLSDSPIKSYLVALTTGLVLMLPVACGAQTPRKPSVASNPNHLSEKQNIQEAVFRYLFLHNQSGHQDKPDYYCLSVAGSDPSYEFMRRFKGNKRPVRKASQCSADPFKGVSDKSTGKRGLIFGIDSIKWNSATSVEVEGG